MCQNTGTRECQGNHQKRTDGTLSFRNYATPKQECAYDDANAGKQPPLFAVRFRQSAADGTDDQSDGNRCGGGWEKGNGSPADGDYAKTNE